MVVAEPTKLAAPSSSRKFPLTFLERLEKVSSWKKNAVSKLFKMLLQSGMKLPEAKKPEEADKTEDPSYCPYHRCLGHTIENCITFKPIFERQYKTRKIGIPVIKKKSYSVKYISASGSKSIVLRGFCFYDWCFWLCTIWRCKRISNFLVLPVCLYFEGSFFWWRANFAFFLQYTRNIKKSEILSEKIQEVQLRSGQRLQPSKNVAKDKVQNRVTWWKKKIKIIKCLPNNN